MLRFFLRIEVESIHFLYQPKRLLDDVTEKGGSIFLHLIKDRYKSSSYFTLGRKATQLSHIHIHTLTPTPTLTPAHAQE